jgi:hypothetical protein
MLLPIQNGSTQEYFFSVDPSNDCPEGYGELPAMGVVTGFVTDESGNPIEGTIVEIGGFVGLSNDIGNYSLTTTEGGHSVWAVKTGYAVYHSNVTVIANSTVIHNIVMTRKSNATETHLYDFNQLQTNDNPPPTDFTGRYTQKPVIEEPKKIEGTDYIISVAEIKRKLRQENFLQEQIFFISYKKTSAAANFEVTGDVKDFFELDTNRIILAPNGRETLTYTIFGRANPGIYNGTLEITGDLNASIPIEIEIIDRDKLPVEALLVELEVNTPNTKPGEKLQFQTHLRNLLSDQQYPVQLFYTIQTPDGNETIWSYSTNVFIKTAVSINNEVRLPTTIKTGDYVIRVTANYLDLSTSTNAYFTVGTPFSRSYSSTGFPCGGSLHCSSSPLEELSPTSSSKKRWKARKNSILK